MFRRPLPTLLILMQDMPGPASSFTVVPPYDLYDTA